MSKAKRAGFSGERLRLLERVLREDYLATGDVPNAMIQVWRRGELVHHSANGFLDVEARTTIREDAIFRIYSMTKPITGTAILMLMEDGKIDLDDEVSRFIPSWKDLAVYEVGTRNAFRTKTPKRPMQIRDLLTHTSGLTYEWMNASEVDKAYLDAGIGGRDFQGGLEGFVTALSKIPLDFSPGEHWNYSVSMDVLAYIVQAVSGMSFSRFLSERIFKPLGMTDTAHHCPPEKADRLVSCYEWKDNRLARDDRRTSMFGEPPSLEEGGAGLLSTIGDYMRFCRMLLGKGELDGTRLLSPKSVSLFSTNMLPGGRTMGEMYVPGRSADWRMGADGQSICCGVTLDPGRKGALGSPGDFYWSGACMTQFWVDPTEDLAVVFMTQVMGSPHHFRIPRVLRALVYGAMTGTAG